MIAGILFSIVIGAQPDVVTLSQKQGTFIVRAADWIEKVRIKEQPEIKLDQFEFADGNLLVKFDGTECTVSLGTYRRSTRFKDIPTSPRLFSKEQIQNHLALIEQGRLSSDVSALSGFELIGNNLYMLWRWDTTPASPGFEALVALDISQEKPWFKVIDKMPGISRATGKISDDLFLTGRKLAVVAGTTSQWGLATWDIDEGFMQFSPIGTGLARYSIPKASASNLLFVERSVTGTWIAGKFDLREMARTNIAESRDKVSFVSVQPVIIRFDSPEEAKIRYPESGLEKVFPAWTAARFTPHGLLTWSPAATPDTAKFFELGSWSELASWRK